MSLTQIHRRAASFGGKGKEEEKKTVKVYVVGYRMKVLDQEQTTSYKANIDASASRACINERGRTRITRCVNDTAQAVQTDQSLG